MVINKKLVKVLTFVFGFILLIISFLASLSVGASTIDFETVIRSLFASDKTNETLIIQGLRLPRAIVGVIIGANLAIAGAIMQAITRNPLASPQIFGVNSGASLIIVTGIILFPNLSSFSLVYLGFIGAILGGSIVYAMASSGGSTNPVRLALAGITVHLFLSAIIEGLVIFHEDSTQNVLFWLAGAIDGSDWADVLTILPWSLIAIIGALVLARSITLLGLGDDMASGLGQNVGLIRLSASILVVILAGVSVAIAGPIGFIGLIIPHIARRLVGVNYLYVIPCSGLLGAVLLVSADVLSRFIAFPSESPVGIVTAIIGGPYFLYLARKGGKQ